MTVMTETLRSWDDTWYKNMVRCIWISPCWIILLVPRGCATSDHISFSVFHDKICIIMEKWLPSVPVVDSRRHITHINVIWANPWLQTQQPPTISANITGWLKFPVSVYTVWIQEEDFSWWGDEAFLLQAARNESPLNAWEWAHAQHNKAAVYLSRTFFLCFFFLLSYYLL